MSDPIPEDLPEGQYGLWNPEEANAQDSFFDLMALIEEIRAVLCKRLIPENDEVQILVASGVNHILHEVRITGSKNIFTLHIDVMPAYLGVLEALMDRSTMVVRRWEERQYKPLEWIRKNDSLKVWFIVPEETIVFLTLI